MKLRERRVAAALWLTMFGGLSFAVAYGLHASTAALAFGIVIAATGLCVGLALWSSTLIPQEQVVDRREKFFAHDRARSGLDADLARVQAELARPALLRLLLATFGVLGVAALLPLRSLGPAPGNTLFKTKWRRGVRVVRDNGAALKRGDLIADEIVTAFPEGAVGDAASQVVLLRLPADITGVRADRAAWMPDGYAAFSKVCTHAGCPVALYRAAEHQLMCPCHQSLFDVLNGAAVVSGPADRPLPQLPIAFDRDGYLRAQSDFSDPVGPGFWEHA